MRPRSGRPSFPSVRLSCEDREDSASRPDICIGTDSYHTPDRLRDTAVAAFEAESITVTVDRPFAGALVPASHHGLKRSVTAIMIEVNRKLYMDEETGVRDPRFSDIKALLERVITTDLSKIDN